MADRVGQQLGNYRLIRLLGEGGFAEVYLGEHIHLGTEAAIKVLHTQLTSDDMEQFRSEARTIARLKHSHIIRVLDFGVEGKIAFLVMDYAPKGSLRQRYPKGVILPLSRIVSFTKQIATALQYAHNQKLIHRDIKPENMLLESENEILLSDFGIATIAHSTGSLNTQEGSGTIYYMAPEQIQGKPRLASDQYALGVVVYEWLSGLRPFNGTYWEITSQHLSTPPPPFDKVLTIPPDVEWVVMKALTKDPKQRFGSVQAFANALERAMQSEQATFMKPHAIPLPFAVQSPEVSPSHPITPTPVIPPLPPAIDPEEIISTAMSSFPQLSGTSPPPSPVKKSSPISPKSTSRPSRLSMWAISSIISLALLIILASFGVGTIVIRNMHSASYSSNVYATVTARSAQETRSAGSIINAQAIYKKYVDSNKPDISMNARDQTQQWDENSLCVFTNDGIYQATNTIAGHYMRCMASNTNFKNFAYEVQMQIVGDVGGVIFRYDSAQQFYRFSLNTNGVYKLFVCQVSTCPDTTVDSGMLLVVGNLQNIGQTTILTVIAIDKSIYLYVNHIFVNKVEDSTISQGGEIGVFAASEAQPTQVTFSNVQVWNL